MSSPAAILPSSPPDHHNLKENYAGKAGENGGSDFQVASAEILRTPEHSVPKRGLILIYTALAFMSIVLFLDNSTTFTYLNYAASDFNQFSLLATVSTASTIVNAVSQPPIAKISDVLGRWFAVAFCLVCQIVAYVLMAASSSMTMYSVGYIIYTLGLSGLFVLGQIIISDFTSSRGRTVAVACFYIPSFFSPFISSFIIDRVVSGVGWRWGLGVFAILYPAVVTWLVFALGYYERRARKSGLRSRTKLTLAGFCSQVDLGGNLLLCAAFAMILLPATLAGTNNQTFDTIYLRALLALGVCSLIILLAYEHWIAKHPVLPFRYFGNLTIVVVLVIAFCDYFALTVTHTYLYSWAIVARDFSPRDANFLLFANAVPQGIIGIPVGFIVYKVKKYKYVVVTGVVVRTIGYGLMLRLRGADNSVAELYIVQVIQGIGSGILEAVMVAAVQVVVPHVELAQATSVLSLCRFTGSAIGSAVAGGIYNNLFESKLRYYLGSGADESTIEALFVSIAASMLPDWGTPERMAAVNSYSDVMKFMVIAAAAASGPMLLGSLILPNLTLGDSHNLVEDGITNGKA